ncbi:MAG: hypothetical protein ACP6IU_04695 [Candidatus Asgardarchaeia archaeon]
MRNNSLKRIMLLTLVLWLLIMPYPVHGIESKTNADVTIVDNRDIVFNAVIGLENKTLTYGNITTTLPNVTAILFNESRDEFINETFHDINFTLSTDYNLTIANFTLDFNYTDYTFIMSFFLNDTVKNVNITTSENETLILNDTYTFSLDWLGFTIFYRIKNNVTIGNETTEVTWNASDIFVFNALKNYPVETWNKTWNKIFYNATLSNTSYIYVEVLLPELARNITIEGNTITYHIPKPIEYPTFEYTAVAGILAILLGLGLFIYTGRESRIEKFKRKILKKEKQAKKAIEKETKKPTKPKKEKPKKKKWTRYKKK